MTDDTPTPGSPTDEALLEAVARMWEQADPPPPGLADGVLARLAAEATDFDAEFELLTLVESAAPAGVRSAAPAETPVAGEVGTWALEYVGPDLRVYVRITRGEDGTRLDGWVVPALPLTVTLVAEGQASVRVETDRFGRFEIDDVSAGLHRLSFVEQPRTTARPRVTPPFWI